MISKISNALIKHCKIVFAIQFIVNTIFIFFTLILKNLHGLYIIFGLSALIQTIAVIIIALIASTKSPFVKIVKVNHKYLILDSKDMPKGVKK
jgi:hypothetical protein